MNLSYNLQEKNEKMFNDFKDVIYKIAEKNHVDLGVAFDMLKAVARGNTDYAEGIEIDMNKLRYEYQVITNISTAIYENKDMEDV